MFACLLKENSEMDDFSFVTSVLDPTTQNNHSYCMGGLDPRGSAPLLLLMVDGRGRPGPSLSGVFGRRGRENAELGVRAGHLRFPVSMYNARGEEARWFKANRKHCRGLQSRL